MISNCPCFVQFYSSALYQCFCGQKTKRRNYENQEIQEGRKCRVPLKLFGVRGVGLNLATNLYFHLARVQHQTYINIWPLGSKLCSESTESVPPPSFFSSSKSPCPSPGLVFLSSIGPLVLHDQRRQEIENEKETG